MNCNPPGSSVHRILHARILEWVAYPPPGHLPDPKIEPASLTSSALAGGFFTTWATWSSANKQQDQNLNLVCLAPDPMLLTALLGHRASQVALNAGDVKDVGSKMGRKGPWRGSGRSPGGGHGNPLQYFCVENPKDRGAWQATVHRITKSWTQLK